MKKLSLTLAFLMICNIGNAQSRALEIEGPAEVAPGQLVRLTAQLAPEESPLWIVLEPIDLDYEQVENGKRLIFAIGCEQKRPITILLLAQQVADGRIQTRQVRQKIEIAGAREVPDKTPGPDLETSPLFDLVVNAKRQIQNVEALAAADLVANNFEIVAKMCESESLKTREEIWSLLSESNHKVLRENSIYWEPVGNALQAGFQELQLDEIADHAFHLRAAAFALRGKQ